MQVRGDVPSFQIPIAAAVAISMVLVPLTGLFAGLTIGLLSLDKVGLRVRDQEPKFLLIPPPFSLSHTASASFRSLWCAPP